MSQESWWKSVQFPKHSQSLVLCIIIPGTKATALFVENKNRVLAQVTSLRSCSLKVQILFQYVLLAF
jgi:hypothetical protein